MLSLKTLDSLIGNSLRYEDEETGLEWRIEILNVYRNADYSGITILITDYVKVTISEVALIMRDLRDIVSEIYKEYSRSLNN